MIVANEILMYFRQDKKNSKNVSLYEEISYDKEVGMVDCIYLVMNDVTRLSDRFV